MTYSYQAKDGQGRTITGSLEAPDERAAARQVRDLGYFPIRVAPATPSRGTAETTWPPPPHAAQGPRPDGIGELPARPWQPIHLLYALWSGVGLRDLALFYRQFAAMLNAGVPIYQSLTTLALQTSNRTLRDKIRRIGAKVQAGETLSGAMAAWPWIFLDFHRALVTAGEMTGRLDLMFARLADALEQEYALRAVIKREMFQPSITLVASFLLPPLVILIVQHDPGGYFKAAILPLIVGAGALLALFIISRLASLLRVVSGAILAHLPGVGGAVRMVALARFCRALATLYAAGLSVPRAVHAAAEASGNAYLAQRIQTAIPHLNAGEEIAPSLMATGVFPPMTISMVGVGEQTGALDETMDRVAAYYEQEAAVRLHQLSVSLSVAMTILVGIKIAIIVIGFYKGYFDQLLNEAG